MNSGKVLLGLLAGVATGALLGVLFAPNKGSDTRKKIVGKKNDLTDALKEKFNELLNDVIEKFDQVKEKVSDSVNEKHQGAEKEV